MERRKLLAGLIWSSAGLVSGCTGLTGIEKPTVKLTNLRLLESSGLSLRFAVDLAVTNTGSVAIPVRGLSWAVSLEGAEILSGVTNDVPTIAPYSEVPLTLEATTNLTGMLGLFTRLMQPRDDAFDYELRTRIGLTGLRLPLEYTDRGSIRLDR